MAECFSMKLAWEVNGIQGMDIGYIIKCMHIIQLFTVTLYYLI